jgi:chromatin-remodeling ATPase INO80
LYEEAIEFGDHKKSWAIVVRNVNKVGRFKAKYRNDFREFIRRLVYFAAKEIRRKHLRC